jgi:hypothetical protein
MKIEPGWLFNTADFSCLANGILGHGNVTLIRDEEGRNAWHKLPEEILDSEDCPELYVCGSGRNLEAAIVNANLAAAHAKPLTLIEEKSL